ncbi:MAG: LytR/AlgR family response regulator transcription factor [Pseudomonadota bacterium]
MSHSGATLRAVLVDDEPLARRGLQIRLAAQRDVEVVAECANGIEALRAVADHHPDLMFLDVQMPGLDGFATLRELPADSLPLVVFVTAFDHYAIRAFEASAIDYLLKPIDDTRLVQSLDRVRQQLREQRAEAHCARLLDLLRRMSGKAARTLDEALGAGSVPGPRSQVIAFKDGNRIVRLDVAQIRWIDAAGDYLCVHSDDETLVVRGTLRDIEQRLDAQGFTRIHRSTIVNVRRVRELRSHINGEFFVVLQSGQTLKLSRTYRDRLQLLRG